MAGAVQHGSPGEWARVNGTVFSLWPLFLCFALLGAFGAALLIGNHPGIFAGLFVASFIFAAVLWRRGLRRVESYFKGARGEERVARLLANLPEDCHVFHDFESGRYHVDHVVVCPAGVFSIETKNWRGAVTVEEGHVLVDGRLPSRSPLSQAVKEADAVAARLKNAGWTGTITPVVCFASNSFDAGRGQVGSVYLLNSSEIIKWIADHPAVLSADDLVRLVRLMDAR